MAEAVKSFSSLIIAILLFARLNVILQTREYTLPDILSIVLSVMDVTTLSFFIIEPKSFSLFSSSEESIPLNGNMLASKIRHLITIKGFHVKILFDVLTSRS
jgi:uncharacterized membrane protein YkgB